MREVKFRGISEFEGKWVYGFGLSKDEQGVFLQTKIDDYVFIKEGSEGQFTGLKDKNGREIWEGDIIAYLDSADCSTEAGYDFYEFMNKGEIVFNEDYGRFDVTNRSDIDYHDFIDCLHEYEVIGNIYEHPHLLEGVK